VKVLPGSEPSRPGAFRVEGAIPLAARYRWALVVDAPGLADRHDLGSVTVFADEPAANADAEKKRPADDPSAFAYLKEQQWTNAFATEHVREVDLRSALRVPAAIEPISGGEAVVAASAAGRFTAGSLISIGASVRSGQTLGRIEPRLTAGDDRATLASEVAEARAASEAAHTEQTRAERLLAERAVPARRVEDARRAVAVADARLQAAEARLRQRDETLRTRGGLAAGNAFVLRAPIAGRIADVTASLGAARP
jgi:cobalt-zinc-cadmium efflux system membrane fusion protein